MSNANFEALAETEQELTEAQKTKLFVKAIQEAGAMYNRGLEPRAVILPDGSIEKLYWETVSING